MGTGPIKAAIVGSSCLLIVVSFGSSLEWAILIQIKLIIAAKIQAQKIKRCIKVPFNAVEPIYPFITS